MRMRIMAAMVVLIAMVALTGCSSTMNAVKHRELSVDAKMSESIFLDAETLTETPKIFVRVANTSDFQDVDFSQLIREKLGSMGYDVTMKAKEAQYHVTANLLYMGEEKEGLNGESILKSGFGGVIAGAAVAGASGSSYRGAGAAGLITGAVLAGGDALAGSIWHVDTYLGVVDLQIKEEVEGGVTGIQEATVSDGSTTVKNTTREVSEKRQEYRTRIVVSAKQTRMDRAEAVAVVSQRLADQVSGMFRM